MYQRTLLFYSVFIGLFVFSSLLFSRENEKSTLEGLVRCAKTKEVLIGANIWIKGTSRGTTTDENGHYIIKLDPGEKTIVISYVGFEKLEESIEIKLGQNRMDFFLNSVVLSGKEISVTAEAIQPKILNNEIKARELKNIANPVPDVLQTLKTLPGVTSLNDQTGFYQVRGGSYDENLIYINGIEIYQPHIVRKGMMENPSLINPVLVKKINLYSSAFPVSYGDRLSSVLDIEYFDKPVKNIESHFEASLTGYNASLLLKPGEKTSFVAAGRSVDYSLFHKNLENRSGHYSPRFWDIQSVFHYFPNDRLKFMLLTVYAKSDYQAEPGDWKYWRVNEGFYKSVFSGDEKFSYHTFVSGFNTRYRVLSGLEFESVISVYEQKEQENTHISEDLYYSSDFMKEPSPYEYDELYLRQTDVNNDIDTRYYFSKSQLNWKMKKYLSFHAGMDVKKYTITSHVNERENASTAFGDVYYNPYSNNSNFQDIKNWLTGYYLSGHFKMDEKLKITAGLRYTYCNGNAEHLYLPRIQFVWYPKPDLELYLASGKYAQPALFKEIQFSSSGQLDAQQATQYAVGSNLKLRENLFFKAESYFKKLSNLVSYDVKDVRLYYSGMNDAKGYAYGLDLRIYGSFTKGTENWISYSYLKAREQINGTEVYVPRPSDRSHTFSVYMEDKMEKFNNSKIFVRYVFGSGFPYTWQSYKFNETANQYELSKGERNKFRTSAYGRFDIGFSQNFKIANRIHLSMREEILNLFNHVNVLGYGFSFNRRVFNYMGGRVFNIGFRLEFS